jgi:hypothetical protein
MLGCTVVINGLNFVTLDVIEEIVDGIVRAFPRCTLRINSLDVSTGANIPLARARESRIVSGLGKVTVGRV